MKLEMVDTPTEEKIEMDQEEIKPTGDGARSERQERPEWRYHLTINTAEVVISNTLTLRPHWHGPMSPEEIRAVVRMAAAAPALYAALREMYAVAGKNGWSITCNHDECRQAMNAARAALALVDGPTSEDTNV